MATESAHPPRGIGSALDPLIEEAWARRRRRRRRWFAGGVLAVAGVLGIVLSSGRAPTVPTPPPPVHAPPPPMPPAGKTPAQATPSQVQAFVNRAQWALTRPFTARYAVTVPERHRRPIHSTIVAVQRSGGQYVFRETPSFASLMATGFPPAATSTVTSEVFSLDQGPSKGGYTCTGVAGRWSCRGPYTGTGMGVTWQIWGPYPPTNLFLALQNTVAAWSDVTLSSRRTPMYIARRRLDGRSVRCLGFGRPQDTVGTVCVNHLGLIVYYDVPLKVAQSSDYRTVRLESYSKRVSKAAFDLPAAPKLQPS